MNPRIVSVGHAVPERVVTNEDLAALMDTSDEWITERTGIKERRWARPSEGSVASVTNSELGARAAEMALQRAGIEATKVDSLYYASISAEDEIGGSAVHCARRLFGNRPVRIVEVRNQCAGFLFALSMADAALRVGKSHRTLVIGSEILSTGLDLSDSGRHMAVLFGDGAGAVIVEGGSDTRAGILDIEIHTDGNYAEALGVPGPSFCSSPRLSLERLSQIFPVMEGKAVFKAASLTMPESIRRLIARQEVSIDALDLIIPHQANARILAMVGGELGCPEKVFSNIARYGNTTAASIPLALSEAYGEGRISRGDLLCLVAFGAGFSWGSALLRW